MNSNNNLFVLGNAKIAYYDYMIFHCNNKIEKLEKEIPKLQELLTHLEAACTAIGETESLRQHLENTKFILRLHTDNLDFVKNDLSMAMRYKNSQLLELELLDLKIANKDPEFILLRGSDQPKPLKKEEDNVL